MIFEFCDIPVVALKYSQIYEDYFAAERDCETFCQKVMKHGLTKVQCEVLYAACVYFMGLGKTGMPTRNDIYSELQNMTFINHEYDFERTNGGEVGNCQLIPTRKHGSVDYDLIAKVHSVDIIWKEMQIYKQIAINCIKSKVTLEHILMPVDTFYISGQSWEQRMLIMPRCNMGDMTALNSNMKRGAYGPLLLQCLEALREVHIAGYVHKDVKIYNFCVQKTSTGQMRIYIIDFGGSKNICTRFKPDQFFGTKEYGPFAALQLQIPVFTDDLESLVYMVYEMQVASLPWENYSEAQIKKLIAFTEKKSKLPLPSEYVRVIRDLRLAGEKTRSLLKHTKTQEPQPAHSFYFDKDIYRPVAELIRSTFR